MKQYGIVLIGCGHIGKEHIENIYYKDNIHIVAVIDTDIERADLFLKKYHADFSDTDYHTYINRDDVDIVIAATYTQSHLSILKDCISAGKHLLCEKPIACNAADGEEFYCLVKNSPVHVSVAHILRYNQTYRRVKELIDAGTIGELKLMRMVQNHHCKDWDRYQKLLKDCSPILDCGVHYFDVMQWFSNSRIAHVSGIGTVLDDKNHDFDYNYGIVNLELENGAVGYYEAGWSPSIMSANIKEFVGTKGSISITLQAFRSSHVEEGDLIEIYTKKDNTYRSLNINAQYKPMWKQLQALIDLIENRPSEAPSMEDVYSAFRVGICADEAIRQKKRLSVLL